MMSALRPVDSRRKKEEGRRKKEEGKGRKRRLFSLALAHSTAHSMDVPLCQVYYNGYNDII